MKKIKLMFPGWLSAKQTLLEKAFSSNNSNQINSFSTMGYSSKTTQKKGDQPWIF